MPDQSGIGEIVQRQLHLSLASVGQISPFLAGNAWYCVVGLYENALRKQSCIKINEYEGMNLMRLPILFSAALLATQAASASTLSLTYDGYATGYRAVTIDQVDVDVAGGLSTVAAGGFDMNDSTSGGLGDFVAWCLDLGAFLGTSGSHEYEVTDTPFQNGSEAILDAGMARISAVFNANFDDSVLASSNASSAFQLALWEVVYDDDMDITAGVFQASSSSSVESLAMSYLTAANEYEGANLWDLSYLESTAANRSQNLVTAELSAVPLPATGLLLIGALGGLVAARRRKTV